MPIDDFDKVKSTVNKILLDTSFKKLLKSSSSSINPSVIRCSYLMIILIFILYIFFNFSDNSIFFDNFRKFLEVINTIFIAMLAVIITGYSIYYSMMSTNSLKTFIIQNSNDGKSLFLTFNYFFFAISILYLSTIILNFIIILFFDVFQKVLGIYFTKIFFSIYSIFCLNALIEFKSFIYNLYQSVSISSIAKIIEDNKKEKNE